MKESNDKALNTKDDRRTETAQDVSSNFMEML